MRKIILGVAVSLDGFIEGPNGEYDWCFTDQDYGMTEFMKNIDAIFYGRKSYEMMLQAGGPGENPFASKKSYVFSNTWRTANKDYELVSGNIEEKVMQLKRQKGLNVWLFGGAALTTSFMKAGLVDELWLSIHPILLGKGKPLFSDIDKRVKTELLNQVAYNTGLLQVTYRVINQ